MNEELINQLVRRILSEPTFKALLQGNKAGSVEELKMVKLEGLVLLNYVPDLERVITALKQQFGAEYTLNILPSDQTLVDKPNLPEGMNWITPQAALKKTTWQKIIIPACSPNTLAKAALGIRDNPLTEMIGRGITQGIPCMFVTEYLGFTAQTPKAYMELYERYLEKVKTYGVLVSATLGEGCNLLKDTGVVASTEGRMDRDKGTVRSAQDPVISQAGQYSGTGLYEQRSASQEQLALQNAPSREVICYEKKFLADKDAYGIAEETIVLVKRGTVISPLARDTLKSRRIELRQEMEEGRR
ncbi:MAG TPA: flavoprotein [Desulfosporosinus sp.]|nr:flavoprotein [Desulfosporosinus sp.]